MGKSSSFTGRSQQVMPTTGKKNSKTSNISMIFKIQKSMSKGLTKRIKRDFLQREEHGREQGIDGF